ncbi:MAG: hypothetical protein HY900_12135 [Deltaproteobacteria bacterium]|nr:hypothetical protein [Deltaproteobacteria bacterium]
MPFDVSDGIRSRDPCRRVRWIVRWTCLAMLGAGPFGMLGIGCGQRVDRLYALRLDRAPTEAQWEESVALHVTARGGRTSRPGDADVDSDAVHTATASCHHGTGAPPVDIRVRAFYTAECLYLRAEWVDPTEDVGHQWRWDGARWVANLGEGEDGLGILWGPAGRTFSCEQACHLRDWKMEGPRAYADYVMVSPPGTPPLDLWIWRSGRGRVGGMAEDARLTATGRLGDGAGEWFAPNSLRASSSAPNAFGPGDTPLEAPAPAPGALAPAFRLLPVPSGRSEVEGRGSRGRGTWRVTLSRRLRGLDPDDVAFAPGQELRFGLSTLDGVVKDHNAVSAPIHLVLVDPAALTNPKE